MDSGTKEEREEKWPKWGDVERRAGEEKRVTKEEKECNGERYEEEKD